MKRKPIRGPFRWVSGPRPHGKASSQVTVCLANGKRRARTFTNGAEAIKFADKCRGNLIEKPKEDEAEGETPQDDFPEYDGTSKWWSEILGKASEAAYCNPTDANLARVRALSQSARAAASHVDMKELERRLAVVEKRQATMDAARKHGTGTKRSTRPSRKAPRPGRPVR